jgi:predicted phage terminase large subunit-like protein
LRFCANSNGGNLNKYIFIDPANSKKKTSDYTAMVVWGLGEDRNYYLLDMVRDRLSLTERGDHLFNLHKKWRPLDVGYEGYGMQADIDYMRDRMSRENYHFNITPLGGKLAKPDRIGRLIPPFEEGRIYFPHSLFKTDYEGKYQDLIDIFLTQEYDAYPVSTHDDMLDAMARITDEDFNIVWPIYYEEEKPTRYSVQQNYNRGSSWAA